MSFFRSTTVAAFVLSSIVTCTSPQTQAVVPGAYIVEFMDDIADAPSFYTNLSDNRITASPRITLSHQLFNGASFNLEGTNDVDAAVQTIQEMGMVSKIWPVRLYSNPATLLATIDKISSFDTSTLRKRDDEVVDTYSPHVMGGVDKLHDAGFTGEGLFIGVVDTGVDYNHPALGGGFGPGFKVVTGYDLVGDDYTGFNTPVPDPDPIDCGGHGTHVSGIIAADFNEYNFTGVAPNSSLGVWKVFGCEGQVGNDVLIAAFNMAYEAGVDLISASIGGESGWTEDPWDVAVQRITEKGVPCIIAAGNDGANGLFDTSTASESIGATSVGSIDNINQPAILIGATTLEDGANATQFWYAKGNFGDFGTITAPLYVITLDTTITADACSALPDSTPDLSEYVVLIRRGTCTFDTKIANAAVFGAQRFLFYNNVAGVPTSPGDSSTTIPVGMVSAAKGAEFVAAVAAGAQISVEFTALEEALLQFTNDANEITGGKISTFSSWGPSFEAWIKPEVSAPGGLILSTYPLSKGGYAVESGTSMATPYISGVVALIKQIRGKNALTPDAITSLLASTADPVNFNDGVTTYGFLAPVVQQGGGLVNAFEAAYTNTFLDLDNVALNDTDFFEPAHQVKISNTGSTAQTYTFENVIAATAFTLDTGIFPVSFPPGLDSTDAAGATIRFEPSSLTVEPKSSGILTMHFTLPQALDATRIPVYSGFVFINGTSDALSLPYAGIASSLKDAAIMDFPDGFPYVASSADLSTPLTNGTQTFILAENSTNSTFPTIVYALAMGSRILRVDVVPEDVYGLPRVIGQQILGSIPSYPAENVPRNFLFSASWDGSLADGSVAPAGKYKFLVRALKIFGNATNDQDYESFSTVYFDIKYAE